MIFDLFFHHFKRLLINFYHFLCSFNIFFFILWPFPLTYGTWQVGQPPHPSYPLAYILYIHHYIKALVCQWVSLCDCFFPNSSKTANPSELKFWGMISLGIMKVLGLKNIRIRWTVSKENKQETKVSTLCIARVNLSDNTF